MGGVLGGSWLFAFSEVVDKDSSDVFFTVEGFALAAKRVVAAASVAAFLDSLLEFVELRDLLFERLPKQRDTCSVHLNSSRVHHFVIF